MYKILQSTMAVILCKSGVNSNPTKFFLSTVLVSAGLLLKKVVWAFKGNIL
jgi:hypothetical protein